MKVLILGASGMIGHRIWLLAQEKFGQNAFGVIHGEKAHFKEYKIFNENIFENVDVQNWESVEEILNKVKPDYVVNAIGITIRKPAAKSIETCLEVNSFFPHRLLKWAQRSSSQIIHLSTDCVFDGASGRYSEKSNPTAKDNYGRSKFLGEIVGERGLTLRFSCIGRELSAHTELLDWALMQNGKKIKGYTGAIYTGVTTLVVAREVISIIERKLNLQGIFQLSSRAISKYDLLQLICNKYSMKMEIEPYADYVADKSLDSEKYSQATGFQAPSWEEMIDEIIADKKIEYKKL